MGKQTKPTDLKRSGTRYVSEADADYKPAGPPTMSRSRAQIATAYAPGVLMTWEGGKGICKSVPILKEFPDKLPANVTNTIFEGLDEFASNWLKRATDACPSAPPQFALDDSFYDLRTNQVSIDRSRFTMNKPDVVGYLPYPLLYQCGECGSVREFQSISEQANKGLPKMCHGHPARWTQVDVVFVHWYGTVEPLSPYNWAYDRDKQEVKHLRSCGCGWPSFRLKNKAPVFSEWKYVCEGCGDTRDLKKAEPNVLLKLSIDQQRENGRQFEWIEVNMLPVSYRASSAFYPQRASFIELRRGSVVELMGPARQNDLLRELSALHSIPFLEPSDEEIRSALTNAGLESDWDEFVQIRTLVNSRLGRGQDASAFQEDMRRMREKWFTDGIVTRGALDSAGVTRAVANRGDWSRKYDPVRLTIEHAAFVSEHINEGFEHRTAVDVMKPDITLSETAGIPEEVARYQAAVGEVLQNTGVAKMVLLRSLPICEYSFGFTRVSSTPVYHREYQNRREAMPVRLVAFDKMTDGARPIYVTQQKNEALYIKLDEARVRRWLAANGVIDVPGAGTTLSRAYIENYVDFGPFLDEFKDKERQGLPRTLAPFVYMLLHSFSHQLIHSLADASGLDRDGIGEYIFPADLAFTIYRKGMTPDLGNISAMWRNHAMDFLRRSVDPRMLRCGSGSLCDSRGGACPACIMVSDVTCMASNLLLSRSALKGGPRPEWEDVGSPDMIGYFDRRLDA